MAQQSFLDKVREWIGGVAWAIFLWSARMTEDEYFAEQDRAAELLRAPVRAAIELLRKLKNDDDKGLDYISEETWEEIDAVLKTAAGG